MADTTPDDRPIINVGNGLTMPAMPVMPVEMYDYRQQGMVVPDSGVSVEVLAHEERGRASLFLYHPGVKSIWVNPFGQPASIRGVGCIEVQGGVLFQISASKAAINVMTQEADLPITVGVA